MDPLQRLIDGNRRYVDGRLQHPNQTPARREEVARGQKPFAAVVACADSRVAPEVVFDQGLGDLFVLRVAGNVANDMILGSLEYAVLHLGVGLVAVIGHKGCGAVQAAIGGGALAAMSLAGLDTGPGEVILAVAVLSIVLTAPLGAWATEVSGRRWLEVAPPSVHEAMDAALESEAHED